MKKTICLLMTMMLLMAGLSGFAENATGIFDYSVFEGKEGFEVDKFDKSWIMSELIIGDNVSLLFAPAIQGYSDGTIQLAVIAIVDIQGNSPDKIQFLIDETVYSFDLSGLKEITGNTTAITLTREKVEFFEILANAKEISIRITCDGTTIEDTFTGENLQESQELIREMLRQDAASCYNADSKNTVELLESAHLQDMEVR